MMNENFNNVFDSSLVDYSNDLEKKDLLWYKEQQIRKWMDENTTNQVDYKEPCKYRLDKDLNIYIDVPYYEWDKGDFPIYGGCIIRKRSRNEPIGNFPDYINMKLCKGNFDCQGQNMTTLRGCPERVEGSGASFWCRHNQLKNLVGGPTYVQGNYNCTFNPLESLEGIPEYTSNWNIREGFTVPKELEGELLKRVRKPGDMETYKMFIKRKDYDTIKMYGWDDAYWTKNVVIDEGLSNAFDSDLTDYSKDFAKRDREETKTFDFVWASYKNEFRKKFTNALIKGLADSEKNFKKTWFSDKDNKNNVTVDQWLSEHIWNNDSIRDEREKFNKADYYFSRTPFVRIVFYIPEGIMYRIYKLAKGTRKYIKYNEYGRSFNFSISKDSRCIPDEFELTIGGSNTRVMVNGDTIYFSEDSIYLADTDTIVDDFVDQMYIKLDNIINYEDAFDCCFIRKFANDDVFNLYEDEALRCLKEIYHNLLIKSSKYGGYCPLDESLDDAFDSSLTDYSKDAEKADIEYLKKNFEKDAKEKIDDLYDEWGGREGTIHGDYFGRNGWDELADSIATLRKDIERTYKKAWIPEYKEILDREFAKAYDDMHSMTWIEDDAPESEFYDNDGNWDPIEDDDLYESLDDAFDSSLSDYSTDYEKADAEYWKKQQIIDWIKDSFSIYDVNGNPLEVKDGAGISLLKAIVGSTKEEIYLVDVNGNIEADDGGIDAIPEYVNFHHCVGDFNINGVTLRSLRGCPDTVDGNFYCCDSAIRNFKDGPSYVGEDLWCTDNPQLKGHKALLGFPKVAGDIHCDPNLDKYIESDLNDDGWM